MKTSEQQEKPSELQLKKVIEELSLLERKVIPFLLLPLEKIKEKTNLDEISFMRALRLLEAKGLITLQETEKETIDLGTNGVYYKKNQLPERRIILVLEEQNHLPMEEAHKKSKLSENEFRVSLGVLKEKALITVANGKVSLVAVKEDLVKKSLEEQLLEILPKELEKLPPELLNAYEKLKKRKDIIELKKSKTFTLLLTEQGKSIAGKTIDLGLLEEVTPELIKLGTKGKKFRRYNLSLPVPHINGGKKHFVQKAIEEAKQIWIEMGFKEITGPMVDSAFWVFDALFTPQDHPAREMHDTFFIKEISAELPEKNICKRVKLAHEQGVAGSRGWLSIWSETEAKKVVLRTHTTSISARALASLTEKDLPAKYFTIGKVFRNETLDWSHGFEFYQSEGIVADKKVNFRHLLGYLQTFYKKMGFRQIKFVPSFFAYTEPSVEIQVFHPEKKEWLELGGAGIFRPEVVVPLIGKNIPVLAWGQGFDRIIMNAYAIKDLRQMYNNNIKDLRTKKIWIRNDE